VYAFRLHSTNASMSRCAMQRLPDVTEQEFGLGCGRSLSAGGVRLDGCYDLELRRLELRHVLLHALHAKRELR